MLQIYMSEGTGEIVVSKREKEVVLTVSSKSPTDSWKRYVPVKPQNLLSAIHRALAIKEGETRRVRFEESNSFSGTILLRGVNRFSLTIRGIGEDKRVTVSAERSDLLEWTRWLEDLPLYIYEGR